MSDTHAVTIQKIKNEADNILHLILEKPKDFSHQPGQAVLFHLTKEGADEEPSPFSPVSLPSEDRLEFHIKIYPRRDGLTDALANYKKGDTIEIGEAFGDIQFKGNGTFLAAGTGITPLLAILHDLHDQGKAEGNQLFYTESTQAELIARPLIEEILGDDAHFIITDDEERGDDETEHERLDRTFLESKFANFGDQYFYVCGPPDFVENTLAFLRQKGARGDQLVYEGMS